jgi:hypothetical protein
MPQARLDLLEAEVYLYEHSQSASDKLIEAVDEQTVTLIEYPFMYPVYEHDDRFRLMPLPYQYLCFYHVDEAAHILTIHRVFRGMRDIPNLL